MYEYKVVYKNVWKEKEPEEILNEYAKDGYRVVSVTQDIFHLDMKGCIMIVLEREKKDE